MKIAKLMKYGYVREHTPDEYIGERSKSSLELEFLKALIREDQSYAQQNHDNETIRKDNKLG